MTDLYAGMYDIDIPTIDVTRHEMVKRTRKDHKCCYCGRIIPTGNKAGKITEIFRYDGIQVRYFHIEGQCI